MTCRSAATTICLLVLASTSSAQDFTPVAPDQLVGRALSAEDANFSSAAPGEGWSWSVATVPNGKIYACRRNADGVAFLVLYQTDGRRRMSEHSLEMFVKGVAQSLQRQGFQISALTHAQSRQLFAGAYRFRATLTSTNQTRDRLVGFAGASGGLYSVTAVLGSDVDERLFEEFAASFRLLRTVPMFPPLTIGLMVVDAALLGLACWGALGFLRRRVGSRLAAPLTTLCGLMVALYLGLVAWGVITGARTPDDVDYTLGQVAGVSCVVVAAAVWLQNRLRKRGHLAEAYVDQGAEAGEQPSGR